MRETHECFVSRRVCRAPCRRFENKLAAIVNAHQSTSHAPSGATAATPSVCRRVGRLPRFTDLFGAQKVSEPYVGVCARVVGGPHRASIARNHRQKTRWTLWKV